MKNYRHFTGIYSAVTAILLGIGTPLYAGNEPVEWENIIKNEKTETIIKYFKKSGNVNEKDADGNTPLGWAVYYERTEIVKYLTGAGANLNTVNSAGFTPLLTAAKAGSLEIARALIEKGADPNFADKDSCNAWMWAVVSGHNEIARFLFENGAKKPAGCGVLVYPSVLEVKGNIPAIRKGSGCEFIKLAQGRHILRVAYYEYKPDSRNPRELTSLITPVKVTVDILNGDICQVKYTLQKDRWMVWVETFK